jgi:uncharacterized protein YceH (UPF0502 family)
MPLHLDPTERRVVGSLVEKATTVPEAYPLTLNSLILACNQKSNRDPETAYEERHVLGAVQALKQRGWVEEHERAGGRTSRYAHRAAALLAVDASELALLAELLLRGPQSPQELSTRASRMAPVGSPEQVEARLRALATRPVPLVRLLGRRTGERVARWGHLLAPPGEEPPAAEPARASSPPPPAVAAARDSDAPDTLETLAARVAALEREVASLRALME